MALHECSPLQQVQRVHVAVQGDAEGKRLSIAVESYAEGLGWYAAGSLSFPIHQLPLLEQALADLSRGEATVSSSDNIIPFPGLRIPSEA